MTSWFGSIMGSQADQQEPSGADTVEKLCNRVSSATLLADRRDALRALKSLSKTYRLEVGTHAMDIVINVLQTDRMDTEITGYALETLANVMSAETNSPEDLGVQFIEMFIKKQDNVALILNALEEFDFQIRRPAVKLLTALLTVKSGELQDTILVIPLGISRIMELLSDTREVIRNDGLLLLLQLTTSNSQIQKIIAFENGFETLMGIVQAEGYSEGGIVVQDCLAVMENLLKSNNSNQSFFREASLITRLVQFFKFDGSQTTWGDQKVANVSLMLKVIRILVAPNNTQQNIIACQKAIEQCGLLSHLCSFMFAGGVPTEILIETINTVAEVIRGYRTNQQFFDTVQIPSTPPRSAILALLMSMVSDKQPVPLRFAALYCFQSYLYKNDSGQEKVINTLLPSSAESTVSVGQVLCAGLFGQDALANWCTAVGLADSLNANLKPQLLRVQLSMQGKGEQVTFLQQCINILVESANLKTQTRMGLLILLCTWLSNCSIAVIQFLNHAANVPFLSGQVEENTDKEGDKLVRGLCAMLLGICIAYHDGSTADYTKDTLRQLIVHRIGKDKFDDCLNYIGTSEIFIKAAKSPRISADDINNTFFDYSFTQLYKQAREVIVQTLDDNYTPPNTETSAAAAAAAANVEPNTSIEDHENIVTSYKELIRDQDTALLEAKKKYQELEKSHSEAKDLLQQQSSEIQILREQVMALNPKDDGETVFDKPPALSTSQTAELQQTIQDLHKLHTSQRQEIVQRDTQIEKLKLELENAKQLQLKEHEEKVKTLEAELAQVKLENNVLLKEKSQLSENITTLKETQDAAVSTNDSQRVSELEYNLKQAKKTYEELKKTQQTQQDQQDDLLVLLAEKDARIKKFKTLLQENKIEFSESESEGEEEESDDDL
ncbi:general vesicular transport factor p115-like [Dysidea avara]|uniref:general vesicular transport factor p115-like n=1 Tax=Dysidea avara TaxID=196820 RepID=UPI00332CA989